LNAGLVAVSTNITYSIWVILVSSGTLLGIGSVKGQAQMIYR